MKATSNYMHNQLLSPLLNILPINYFITTMFGTRDKKAGNLTRKSHEKIMQHTATNLTRKSLQRSQNHEVSQENIMKSREAQKAQEISYGNLVTAQNHDIS